MYVQTKESNIDKIVRVAATKVNDGKPHTLRWIAIQTNFTAFCACGTITVMHTMRHDTFRSKYMKNVGFVCDVYIALERLNRYHRKRLRTEFSRYPVILH